jgi:hypothetical protein
VTKDVHFSLQMDQFVLTDDLPQKGLRLTPQCWKTFKSFKYSHTHHSHHWSAKETAVIPMELEQFSSPCVHLSCPSWCDTCPGGDISVWSHQISCKIHLFQSTLALWCAMHTNCLFLTLCGKNLTQLYFIKCFYINRNNEASVDI